MNDALKIHIVVAEGMGWHNYEQYNVKAFYDYDKALEWARKCLAAAHSYDDKSAELEARYRFCFNKCPQEKTEFHTINKFDPFYCPSNLDPIGYRVDSLEIILEHCDG